MRRLFVFSILAHAAWATNVYCPAGQNTSHRGACFTGDMDEFRVSSTNRSADWIATEYANRNAPPALLLPARTETATAASAAGKPVMVTR